jgi:hypothetical protein
LLNYFENKHGALTAGRQRQDFSYGENMTIGRTLIAIALMTRAACAADQPAKIDFTQPLMDGDVPIVDDVLCPLDAATRKQTCQTPLTLGHAIFYSRRAPEQGIDWKEAVRRDELATRVSEAKDWPLLDGDRQLIEKMLARLFPSPMFLGAAAKVLEPK